MKGLIEFIYLVAIAIGLRVIWCFYRAIKLKILKHKYQSAIKVLHSYGYRYCSYYNYRGKYRGKGLIYRKQLDKTSLDSLLLRYGYEPLELNAQFKVYDYIAIVDYPIWEERFDGVVLDHGGLRLLHFYRLKVLVGDKVFQRFFNHYLDNDMSGEPIGEIALKSSELIDLMISSPSNIKFILQEFNDDEVKYWEDIIKEKNYNK